MLRRAAGLFARADTIRSGMFGMLFLAGATLITVSAPPSPAPDTSGSESWTDWKARHAETDIVRLFDKLCARTLDPVAIARVRQGDTLLLFDPPIRVAGQPLASYDLETVLDWRDRHPEIAAREARITARIDRLIHERQPDTLLLVFAGFSHAARHSLESEHRILYASGRIDERTPFGSPELRELRSLLGLPADPRGNTPAGPAHARLGTYVALAEHARRDLALEPASDRPIDERVIWIADRHGIDDVTVTDMLPRLSALGDAGLQRIVVAVEGFPADRPLDAGRIHEFNDIRSHLSAHELARIASSHPEIASRLQDGAVVVSPSLAGLVHRLDRYAANGAAVQYIGLE